MRRKKMKNLIKWNNPLHGIINFKNLIPLFFLKKRILLFEIAAIVLSLFATLSGCADHYSPKPRGYFRIDLPPKHYQNFDTTFPYAFEYPTYATISPDPYAPKEKYWININFPTFKATLHLSYKTVHHNLAGYLEDTHTLVIKHIAKASAINDSLIIDRKRQVFGLIYDIEGNDAASPYQFFLTDSTSRFVRGALYFNIIPNNDSLEPVIRFIEKDIRHLIGTFRWKKIDKRNEN